MDVTGGLETKKTPTNYSDFIIIGGGSAGSVLANRLTANGRFSVTLIEAGPNSHVLSTIPISFAKFIDNPSVTGSIRPNQMKAQASEVSKYQEEKF